ncbi:SusD/RagB family nutrient-binding outer membrane lipoprotein [Fulvivirga ulvae]|uniref:SusD/RagB family nutrient-binding outer membrane lipoprotein n=1 Tax=Fulvivirga ulvae TaxID=2904245 RepID=UPI001F2D5924|nr:SusD/RagB family nutrient-binding outer membrane lipoprotein [Fulvivirga ulvae]UII29800.1 SusD/RagB family nutrient-binding outer membrane lipoprotein [Fulvivirga ulvae]
MKKHIYIYRLMTVLLSALLLMGCEKDFLDINEDPNNPTSVPVSQLLSSAQVNMAECFGNGTDGLSGHAGTVMHHYVQRGAINDYGLTGGDFPIVISWTSLYAGALTDLNIVIEQGTEEERWANVGVAQILKAYILATMVDVWGDIPFSEANLGSDNIAPAYDDGASVYAALFPMIDEGVANINKGGTPNGDLFSTNWIQVANSLKLKLYNNVRLIQDVSTEVNSLITADNFLANDGSNDLELDYGSSFAPENRNPGYVQEWSAGGSFFYIDPYFFEIMRGQDTFGHGGINFGVQDPRIPYYFFNQLPSGSDDGDAENPCAYCPSDAGTSFLSIYSYSFNIDPNEGFDQGRSQTIAGLYPLGGRYDDGEGGIASNASTLLDGQVSGNPTIPQRLLNYYETLYIRAELAEAGVTSEDARTLLADAIDASFAKVNEYAAIAGAPAISDADRDAYKGAVLASYDSGDGMEVIMTQKWIASYGNSLTSYADYRRTGFPRLHNGNTDALSVTVQTRDFPVSFPYDTDNLALNPNSPSQRIIALDKVFWDN